jgi:hypothetical protein
MNIISNSCIGGFIYKNNLNCNYKNPFIWNLIDFNSMYYLIKNYENINFKNYILNKDDNWNFSIVIENNITLKFIHYKFDKNATKIIKKDIDVYYNRIWEYIVDKYEQRLNIMLNEKSKPLFILADGWNPPETKLDIQKLKLLNDLKKDNIICAVDKIYSEFTNIKQTLRNTGTAKYGANPRLAKKIYDEFLK